MVLSVVAPNVKHIEEMYFPYIGEVLQFKQLWEMQGDEKLELDF